MKVASDFRREAREALKGNWIIATIIGLVSTVLGVNTIFAANGYSLDMDTEGLGQILAEVPEETAMAILAFVAVFTSIIAILNIIIFFVAGPSTLGYVKVNLDMLDGKKPEFVDLLSGFKRYKEGFLMHFVRLLFIGLWILAYVGGAIVLGVICAFISRPLAMGVTVIASLVAAALIIVKYYDYALAPYIVYEYPEIGARTALQKSKQLMDGNRWRLFCLMFSFIGWALLAAFFTFGMGFLVLKPYQEAAYAAFYRQIMTERNRSYRLNIKDEDNGEVKEVESVVTNYRWNY